MVQAANLLVGYPNHLLATYIGNGFAGVSLYGGAWYPGTVENLLDMDMESHAVSLDCNPNSTQLIGDLGVTRGIKCLGFPDGNYSRKGLGIFDVAAADDPGFTRPVYSSGELPAWRVVYPLGTLPSWHPAISDGKLTEEERAEHRLPFFSIVPDGVAGRYVRFRIIDPQNPDGCIRIPHWFVTGGWQAKVNLKTGRGISYQFNTEIITSLGGVEDGTAHTPPRLVAGEFDVIGQDEAYAFPLAMQKGLQNLGVAFVSIEPQNDRHLHVNSFMARLREPSPFEKIANNLGRMGFMVKEAL